MPRNGPDPLIQRTIALPRSVWEQIERFQLDAELPPSRSAALWLVVHRGLVALAREVAQRQHQPAPTAPLLH
jgi:hypothetical protein